MDTVLEAQKSFTKEVRNTFIFTSRTVLLHEKFRIPPRLFEHQLEILFLQKYFYAFYDAQKIEYLPGIFTVLKDYHEIDKIRYPVQLQLDFEREHSSDRYYDQYDFLLDQLDEIMPKYRSALWHLERLLGSTPYNPSGHETLCREAAIDVLDECRFGHGFSLYSSCMEFIVNTLIKTWNSYGFILHT